jgi:SAM-dependent methyltransferase
MTSHHVYGNRFFDYINQGSARSARRIAPLLVEATGARTVIDIGCGAGAWLQVWAEQGLEDWFGVDGDYVEDRDLLIPSSRLHRCDLSRPFSLRRKYDLVCSLEVAEHIAPAHADQFVDSLVEHGDVVAFSAATPGQGGEFHVNEQPYGYWRDKFAARGFACFDAIRPLIAADDRIEPWYRYNILLFANREGAARLSAAARDGVIDPGAPVPDRSPLAWKLRRAVLGRLPGPVVNGLAMLHHRIALATQR